MSLPNQNTVSADLFLTYLQLYTGFAHFKTGSGAYLTMLELTSGIVCSQSLSYIFDVFATAVEGRSTFCPTATADGRK